MSIFLVRSPGSCVLDDNWENWHPSKFPDVGHMDIPRWNSLMRNSADDSMSTASVGHNTVRRLCLSHAFCSVVFSGVSVIGTRSTIVQWSQGKQLAANSCDICLCMGVSSVA